MKTPPQPPRAAAARYPRLTHSCSLAVLTALGIVSAAPGAQAQGPGGVLPAGTLPVLRSVVSGRVAVNAPVPGAVRALMTVDQKDARAIIDWKSFNIASDAEVRFNQPSSTASALNRIYSADPSVIQGKLSANGQVLLINQNGILFDRGSQINVQSLVASTLNMSNARFNTGALTTGGLTSAAFEGGYDAAGNTLAARPDGTRPGVIGIGTFGPGSAAAPSIAAQAGGSILLFAPRIDNESGLVSAPDGQVILAAGAKVYLALPDEADTTLRGFRVEVEAAGGTALNLTNLVRNAGGVSADRGNVTLAALAINQDGRVSANTAIQSNGSVFLQARTLGGAQAGSVSLGNASVTEVRPDTQDKATLPESQSYADRRGEIRVEGRTIASAGTLLAEGGKLSLTASDASDPAGARIYLGAGSTTSVAGHWADLPFDSNLLTLKVTSNELKDSPDQKNGILKGATVTVDLRKGSPLLDLSGYIAAQGRTVAEKTATGGELAIVSSGALIQRNGATLDASGGGYRYGAGTSATSKLLGDDGRIYDIGSAPQARKYTQVLDTFTKTDERWGQTQTFTGLMYGLGPAEAAAVEGKAAGSITLRSAAGLVLDGALKGGVTVGPNQLAKAPRGAALTVGEFNAVDNQFVESQRIGNVSFAQQASDTLGTAFNAATALNAAQLDKLTLAAEQIFGGAGTGNLYTQTGFDSVEINSNGRVVVPVGTRIEGTPGSSLTLRAPQIDIAGTMSLPAGNIALLPLATVAPISEDLAAGNNGVTVRGSGRLSTAGVWINNASADGSFVGDALPSARLNLASDGSSSTTSTLVGGRLTIAGTSDGRSATQLDRGAQLDVGGGGSLNASRRLTLGDGGSLSITNGLSASASSDWLQAGLSGLSAGNGGRLVINTPRAVLAPADANGTLPANTTRLLPELFTEHGFSSVTINTVQGLAVNAGTTVQLQQKNRLVDAVQASALATGADLRAASSVELLPADLRQPMSLTLTTAGSGEFAGQALLTMGKGSAIITDPKGKVTLSALDGLQVDGRIEAPGGDVLLRLNAPNTGAPDLVLGKTAAVSVAGTFVPKPNNEGLVQGSVIGGGTITINATQAGVNLVAGSQLNLDGLAKGIQATSTDGSGKVLQQRVDGNAGTLVIKSQGATLLGASLSATSGSAQGAGGAFALELNARDQELALPAERRIVVAQSAAGLPTGDEGFVDAVLSATALRQAGFDKLRLQSENRIELRGDVALDFARGIRLDAPLLDVAGSGHAALVSASVALGQSLAPRGLAGEAPYFISDRTPSPALPTRAGAGLLSVQAGTIDLFGSLTVNGVGEARLFSDGDIRFTGRNVLQPAEVGQTPTGRQVGSLTTVGNLTLNAAQVYPSTRSDFTLSVAEQPGGTPVAGGYILLAGNGKPAGDVYSAGGRLALVADAIVQGGTVKAPLGEIDLRAGSLLELSPGSTTSVSASGLTVPYGTTISGLGWRYRDGGGSTNLLAGDSAGTKRIELNGSKIDIRPGATVDLSGGGDVQASEFVAGSGGSTDTLLKADTYAIIPKSRLTSLPVDTDLASRQDIGFGLQTAKLDTSVYDRLYIGSGAAVPEGEYVLLPGRYAVLPEAYLVQLQTGSAYANLQPGQTSQLANGKPVVTGYRTAGGTSVRESRTVGVLVQAGSAVSRESDYTFTTSGYFADQAALDRVATPRLPLDAGKLTIRNTATLGLAGNVVTTPGVATTATITKTGLGAEVDISAERIAVVDQVGNASVDASFLQLEGKALSALGSSVLIGGERSATSGGVQITTSASQIVVANSTAGALRLPELLLTANDSIDVRDGSVLAGTGSNPGATATVLKAGASGALLRLSSAAQATLDRGTATDSTRGEIRIDAGASLSAERSLLLDATRTTQSRASLQVGAGGSVSLASSQVSLGETAGVAGIDNGLVLSNAELARLASLDALSIKGYEGIDLYGSTVIGAPTLGLLTLDTGAIRGRALAVEPASSITAREVRLVNSGSGLVAAALPGIGSLTLNTQRLVADAGDKAINGFSTVDMNASSEIVGQGQGRLTVGADWTLRTPQVGVMAGAVQQWQAVDLQDPANPAYSALRLERSAGTAGVSTDAASGGRLALEAGSVSIATRVQARSGAIAVAATGEGGLTLADGGVLDVSGTAKDFHGHAVVAGAGRVALSAANGRVALESGSRIRLAASAQGGNAGALDVTAARLQLSGALEATGAAGGAGGRASLDLGTLADFSALNSSLAAGGFSDSLALRVRSGDLRVAAGDSVKARELTLAADAGRIDVAGTLDASTERGDAKISLWAANGLVLAAGSRVMASGTGTDASNGAALSNGGRVRLSTAGGTLVFADSATIDVRPGAKGETGSVTFGVSRDDANQIAPTDLKGTVLGQRGANGTLADVAVEAQRVYLSGGTVSAADIAGYASDHAAFLAGTNAAGILGGLKGDGGVAAAASLRGATEARSTGDLAVTRAIDLTTSAWLANGQPGTLTLRAAGDLTVSSSIGLPNDNLLDGKTWNLRLAGGADLSAANPLATTAAGRDTGVGNVLLAGNAAKLRTGTGMIEIAAAADFRMDALQSVVYTGGRAAAADTAVNGNTRWTHDGGDISIRAGRDAVGASDEWITEWLRRPRSSQADAPAEWWAYRPNFQQGIGTLGGGDIRIDAGRDVSGLSALLPTTGRSAAVAGDPAQRALDVQGGGNLALQAGNRIDGGSYLVARGDGRIAAGGSVGETRPVQLYLMGASSGDVPAHAAFDIQAGGGVTLQSVNNPTAVSQVNSTGTGPSFGQGPNKVLTYFSYSPDSAVRMTAKSGDVTIGNTMSAGRGLSTANRSLTDTTPSGAFPATLVAAALDGNVALSPTRPLVTYTSPTAELALLAQGSVLNPNLSVSDLSPAAVIDVSRPDLDKRLLSGNDLLPTGQTRLVERSNTTPHAFDVVALTGNVGGTGANASSLFLPAASRVRAGTDIVNLGLTLQNLKASDVSEVRADNGDIRPTGLEIRGPGTLLVQAGRNVDVGTAAVRAGSSDLGGLIATGNNANPGLPSTASARLSVVAGVKGDIDPARFAAAYADLIALNTQSDTILAFYRALNGDPDRAAVLGAANVQALIARDPAYAPYAEVATKNPRVLAVYQDTAKAGSLPLGASAEAAQATALYALLNRETNSPVIVNARNVADLLTGTAGGAAYQPYVALDTQFPRVFADYRQRRGNGGQPQGLTPIIFSDLLAEVTAKAVPVSQVSGGNIFTFLSSIQTYGGSDIDLWAPSGKVIAGLTTPPTGSTIGVVTNAGGAVRSVLSGDFSINQGKVLTAQGGDILIFSSTAGVDAGRGAKTSLSTPPPTRTPITVGDVVVGYIYTIPAAASGSGIQTLTSDPDGVGPRGAPQAGSIYLFAPAGTIDAGEAGIRSGGNLVLNAQTVLNASNIASSGTAVGVPKVEAGSLASSLAAGGAATGSASKAAEDSAAANSAARAPANTVPVAKPTILSVEVLGFGDKNCKEDDKECFGK